MFSKIVSVVVFLALTFSLAGGADVGSTPASLSAAEIVERNVAARGGVQAWRSVRALQVSGKLDAGGNNRPTLAMPGQKAGSQIAKPRPADQVQLPFVMQLKRPRKMRVELQFRGQTAIQVFDGANGWKVRPFLNRHEVEPYTPEEMKAAAMQADLDGPLVDYAAKGTKIEFAGIDKVEGSETYKLKLTLSTGDTQNIWLDRKSFLEVKVEGTPRRLDGKNHPVATYLRDYRTVGGLRVPYVMETAVEGVSQTEKIQIDKIEVNPKLDDSLFAKLR